MENKDQMLSEQTDVVSDKSGMSEKKDESVKYETYRRTLNQAKKADEEIQNLKSQLEAYQQKELETQGKQSELIENLKKKLNEEKESRVKEKQKFAWMSVSAHIKTMADKMGCVDPDALIKLSDFSTVEIKDDFSVDNDQLKTALEESQQKYQYLFKKPVVDVKDKVPAFNPKSQQTKTFKDMSREELRELGRKLSGQN